MPRAGFSTEAPSTADIIGTRSRPVNDEPANDRFWASPPLPHMSSFTQQSKTGLGRVGRRMTPEHRAPLWSIAVRRFPPTPNRFV